VSALAAFRVDGDTRTPVKPIKAGRKPLKPVWNPLTPDRFTVATEVLSWDQSLRKTAWTWISTEDGPPRVVDAGMCRTKTRDIGGKESWADRFTDGVSIQDQMLAVLQRLSGDSVRVAHEAPPMGGGSLRSPHSSVLASQALWIACSRCGITPVSLTPQSAKKLLTGNPKADKPEVGRAVTALNWLDGRELLTNEDLRDAAAIGLTFLEGLR
jgi:Holliday junction resolvasome RuvABC endonuclease subunit